MTCQHGKIVLGCEQCAHEGQVAEERRRCQPGTEVSISAASKRLAREADAIRSAYAAHAAVNGLGEPAGIRLAYTADGWLVTHVGADRWYFAGFELDGSVFLDAFDPSADYERIAAEAEDEQSRRYAVWRWPRNFCGPRKMCAS